MLMISILMATYNGEKYVREQIESLFGQTVQDFTLYVSDDKSTDRTCEIIESYARRYPGRIVLSRRQSNSGGAQNNFLDLMTAHKDDYVMLCDQDDVWLPNKIELTLDAMKQAEKEHGTKTPLLVHTELTATNADMTQKLGAYHKLANLDCSRTALNYALVQNIAAGCTIMYNRALAELIVKPEYCLMHDWWLFLIAAAFGKAVYLDRATILYRQHGGNSVGVCDTRKVNYIFHKLMQVRASRIALFDTSFQAENYLQCFLTHLSEKQKLMLRDYSSIPSKNKKDRITTLLHYKILKNSFIRKIGQFICI